MRNKLIREHDATNFAQQVIDDRMKEQYKPATADGQTFPQKRVFLQRR